MTKLRPQPLKLRKCLIPSPYNLAYSLVPSFWCLWVVMLSETFASLKILVRKMVELFSHFLRFRRNKSDKYVLKFSPLFSFHFLDSIVIVENIHFKQLKVHHFSLFTKNHTENKTKNLILFLHSTLPERKKYNSPIP